MVMQPPVVNDNAAGLVRFVGIEQLLLHRSGQGNQLEGGAGLIRIGNRIVVEYGGLLGGFPVFVGVIIRHIGHRENLACFGIGGNSRDSPGIPLVIDLADGVFHIVLDGLVKGQHHIFPVNGSGIGHFAVGDFHALAVAFLLQPARGSLEQLVQGIFQPVSAGFAPLVHITQHMGRQLVVRIHTPFRLREVNAHILGIQLFAFGFLVPQFNLGL
ncbi:hypothetical protein D3C75_807280 [compost metagenome]